MNKCFSEKSNSKPKFLSEILIDVQWGGEKDQ